MPDIGCIGLAQELLRYPADSAWQILIGSIWHHKIHLASRWGKELGRNLFRVIVSTMVCAVSAGGASADSATDFWNWFERNEAALFEFEQDQENVFDQLSAALARVDGNLTFEFGPTKSDGTRDFIISAGGIRGSFPSVERLHAASPPLDRWRITKYRPRRPPMPITIGSETIKPEEVHFALFRDEDKVGIMLFFEDFEEDRSTDFGQFGFLFLDEALGEYTVATEIGFIEFTGRDSRYFDEGQRLPDLWQTYRSVRGN